MCCGLHDEVSTNTHRQTHHGIGTPRCSSNRVCCVGAAFHDDNGQNMRFSQKQARYVPDARPAIMDDPTIESPAIADVAAVSKARQISTTLAICVAKCKFQWYYDDPDDIRPRCFEPWIPPIVISSGSARNLWNVLRRHPFIIDILRFKNALLRRTIQCSGLCADIDQTDAASGVDLFYAATCKVDPVEYAKTRLVCMSHQHHIAMMLLFGGVLALQWIGTLFNIAMLLRMGTYMVRLVLHVPSFMDQSRFIVEQGEPSQKDIDLVAELQEYLV